MIHTQNTFHRLIDIAEYLVDDRLGIIKFLSEFRRESGSPEFFHYCAQACDTRAFEPRKNFNNSGGASVTREAAMAKALGEAIERYCAAIFESEDFPLASAEAALFPCVQPEKFALYSDKQFNYPDFPYVPFTKFTPVRWTDVYNPLNGDVWFVPASMVFLPYFYDSENGEPPITQPISTGLACHCSFEEAAASAIAEVIERDAFTITWQAMLKMPHIRLETLSRYNQDIVNRFERAGYSITMLNITLEHGIPTILSVLHTHNFMLPAMVFAASAHLDPEHAIRSSLEELAHTRRLAAYYKAERPPIVPLPDYANICNQASHVHLFCDQGNFPLAHFIFSSPSEIDYSDIPNLSTGNPHQDLYVYLERINSVNYQVLLKDITTQDVDELGLKVVRALIPGFHPLFMGHSLRAQKGIRLWEVPQQLGQQGISPETGDNPIPHPYP